MIVTSKTVSATNAKSISSQLTLRGTRDGDLAATLLCHNTSSSTITPSASHPSGSTAERIPLFSWIQLQAIVSSGNLQLLSRHPDDLREYFAWMDSVKLTYGSVSNFLLCERFTARKLLEKASSHTGSTSRSGSRIASEDGAERCFRSWFREGIDCQILVNDWPYSVPRDVVHHVVWSHLPILHRDLVSTPNDPAVESIAWSIVAKRGLCGTISPSTGLKIPSLSDHTSHLPDLKSSLTTDHQLQTKVEESLKQACKDLVEFIGHHWEMDKCEAAFFANPPSLQSVPSLAHFHVLIKRI
ncbi:uncharacterized protein UTRI_01899_B [Ustilago trichophora]|uniref:Uncharacterized protein n=1 Tax=Ustilago trichophora TaxID=86804 RepID=A0A5C3DUJ2_9BASI|nr:uncharacterized protein UTRI_01899_B [Ustilago trichophora]